MEERRRADYEMRERMAKLETKFDNHSEKMDNVVSELKETNNVLAQIKDVLAVNRGAEKASKFVWSLIVSFLGFLGGVVGAFAKHG